MRSVFGEKTRPAATAKRILDRPLLAAMDGRPGLSLVKTPVGFLPKTFSAAQRQMADFCGFKPDAMTYDVAQINQLIRNRRSVFPKQYEEGKPVDDAVVQQLLENATWAPSHGQTEPWKFVVFTGEGLKKLAHFQAELYKQGAGENFKEATYNNLLTNPLKASHVIALCLKRDPNKKFPEQEEIAAVACAVQNLYLSTTAYGLGGYWTTGGVTYKPAAKEFFGLGEDDKLMGFFYLAHVAVPSPQGKRKPVEEKVEWVRE